MRQNLKKSILAVSVTMWFLACTPIQKVDTTAMKTKMKQNTVQRITEADILQKIEMLQSKTIDLINKSMDCNGVENIKFVNIHESTPTLTGKTKEILEAYKYSIENHQNIGNNTQKLNDSTYLFTYVLDSTSQISKKCKFDIALKYFYLKDILSAQN